MSRCRRVPWLLSASSSTPPDLLDEPLGGRTLAVVILHAAKDLRDGGDHYARRSVSGVHAAATVGSIKLPQQIADLLGQLGLEAIVLAPRHAFGEVLRNLLP